MWKKGTSEAAAVQGRREEQNARNELFAGKHEIHIDPDQIPLEDQTIQQLVNTAARTHKDTTATAQRALKAVQESKQIQVDTLRKLEEQTSTMNNISSKMDDIHEELTYAEKLLSYMRRCCCCCIFDLCTGADPEEHRKESWRRRVAKGETQVDKLPGWGQASSSQATARTVPIPGRRGAAAVPPGGPPAGKGDPDIRLPDEHRATEMRLHEETRKQNDMIDQIHQGLDQLLEGARIMNDELAVQNQELDILDAKATATRDRLDDVNKNSQLRNMARGKQKAKKEDDFMPTKAGIAAEAAKRLAGF